jgi:hypothetical protein
LNYFFLFESVSNTLHSERMLKLHVGFGVSLTFSDV